MKQSVTANFMLMPHRIFRFTAAVMLLMAYALLSTATAQAVDPPVIDPSALPANVTPRPPQTMRQISYCTAVGVLPGTDFRIQPKYLDMLHLHEAWKFSRGAGVTIAVIDTGVSPHPRLPHLTGGGDYIMAGGDGLNDCDAHGTLVASIIGAEPDTAFLPPAQEKRRPASVPTNDPRPSAPPPQTITLVPPPMVSPPEGGDNPPPEDRPTYYPFPFPIPGYHYPPENSSSDNPPPAGPPPGDNPPPAGPPPGDNSPSSNNPPASYNPQWHSFVTGPVLRHPLTDQKTKVLPVDHHPADQPDAPIHDAFTGIAPDANIISIRQTSAAFAPKEPFGDREDPQTREKITSIHTMAQAIVHAADLGASVINLSMVVCMNTRTMLNDAELGAAVRYAAVDKNAVIVAAAGDTTNRDCKQNPIYEATHPNDPRGWSTVNTVVTPSWFSDYVLTVGAVDSSGTPLEKTSIAGPWVSIGAPGTDIEGLSPREDSLMNAVDGPENTLKVPTGTSFSTAIVSGVAALVRSRFPELSAHQVIERLIRTARPPARGIDNVIGYGIIDPLAALTWDIPDGLPARSHGDSASLELPPMPPERDMKPAVIASVGLLIAISLAGITFGVATLRSSRKK